MNPSALRSAYRTALLVLVCASLVACSFPGVRRVDAVDPRQVAAGYLKGSFSGKPPGSGLDSDAAKRFITTELADALRTLRHLYLEVRSRPDSISGLPLTLDIRYAGQNFVCGLPNRGPLGGDGDLSVEELSISGDSASVPVQVLSCINKDDIWFRGTVYLKRRADGWRVDDVKWDEARVSLREQLRLEHEWLLTQQRQLSSAVGDHESGHPNLDRREETR